MDKRFWGSLLVGASFLLFGIYLLVRSYRHSQRKEFKLSFLISDIVTGIIGQSVPAEQTYFSGFLCAVLGIILVVAAFIS